jgi:glycosyltransferase involved in cell wall biosynthesis
LPEVVGTDGVTGLLVPPGDPGALALAIGTALDDTGLRARLGAAGRARVLERFTWAAAARATVEQYRTVLDGQAPADHLSGRPPGPALGASGGGS